MRLATLILCSLLCACAGPGKPGDLLPDYIFVFGSHGWGTDEGTLDHTRSEWWDFESAGTSSENRVGLTVGWDLNPDTTADEVRGLRRELVGLLRAVATNAPVTHGYTPVHPDTPLVDPLLLPSVGWSVPSTQRHTHDDTEDEGLLDELGLGGGSVTEVLVLSFLGLLALVAAILKRALIASLAAGGWGLITGKRNGGGDDPIGGG